LVGLGLKYERNEIDISNKKCYCFYMHPEGFKKEVEAATLSEEWGLEFSGATAVDGLQLAVLLRENPIQYRVLAADTDPDSTRFSDHTVDRVEVERARDLSVLVDAVPVEDVAGFSPSPAQQQLLAVHTASREYMESEGVTNKGEMIEYGYNPDALSVRLPVNPSADNPARISGGSNPMPVLPQGH
jgi:hypothetical protein